MILCCGECLIDMLPRETAAGEPAFAPVAGGAVFNTARALARLGTPTGFFSGISTDLFGQILDAALTADGVDHGMAARSDRPTTLAFVSLNDGQAQYDFYDENTAGRMLQEGDLPDTETAGTLFFGGISLAVEPCAVAYEELARRARAAGRMVALDPNVRPGFVRDPVAYRARLDRMIALADIVKISDEDLHWLMGGGDAEALSREMLERGPRLVCLTRGAEGVTAQTAELSLTVAARRVEVVDTVGAGDTFNAGLLAALHEAGALSGDGLSHLTEESLRTALTLGIEAAAITVSRAGANPPRRDELAL